MTIPAREGDRCAVCGTPIEPVELSGTPLEAEDEIVLRCANGHEQHVVRHQPAADGESNVSDVIDPGASGTAGSDRAS